MADLGSKKISSNFQKLLQQDGTLQNGTGSNVSLNIAGHITASGNISSSATITAANFTTGDGLDIAGHISASGDISASNLHLDEYIRHNGEHTQTFIRINEKRFRLNAGGINYIDINDNEGPPRDFTINDGENNVDFKIKGSSNNPLFKTDSSANRIGMHGVGTPAAGLHIGDDLKVNSHITASGNISGSITTTGSMGSLKVDGASVDFSGLPTSDPGVAGRLWNDSNTVKISAG